MEPASPRFFFAGKLNREYLILPSDQTVLDRPGGNVLYAAVGLAIWEPTPPPGIVARVGEDYPQEWLDTYARRGLDTRGVRVLPQAIDVRSFTAFTSRTSRAVDDPVAHFARLELPFPRGLLGYRSTASAPDSRTQLQHTSLRQADIPADF
jgi:hypothetical protein